MTRKLYLLLMICFTTLCGSSQTLRISYESGYGTYNLRNLKALQIYMSGQINGLPVKALVRFPGYINHSASVGYYLSKNNFVGINVSYLTSGGRNHLSDYSGEYKLDMILNGYQIGIEGEHIFKLDHKFDINANIKIGYIKSNLNITEYIKINDLDSSATSSQYKQKSYFLEPNLSVSYNFNKAIAVKAGVGYNLNSSAFNNNLIDWTGLRTRLGIAYSF